MDRIVLRKVRSATRASPGTLQVALFRGRAGRVCGWYIGPLAIRDDRIELPYLPPSDETRATVAVMRALEEARRAQTSVCIIDPEDLWEPAWCAT